MSRIRLQIYLSKVPRTAIAVTAGARLDYALNGGIALGFSMEWPANNRSCPIHHRVMYLVLS